MKRIALGVVALLVGSSTAVAQIRAVAYNTLDKPIGAFEEAQADTIFAAIAATDRNGVAKRVDVVSLQEQARLVIDGAIVDTARILADRLNAIHGVSSYRGFTNGTGTDRISIVYDESTVELLAVESIVSSPRPIFRTAFRPVGYDSVDADFYLYGMHLKAGSSSTDINQRTSSVTTIRNDASSLVGALDTANIIYLGDTNFGDSNELGYRLLTNPGPGEAFDPINLASWPNSGVAEHLTQSTRTSSLGDGGSTGGIDDRFDMQLVTEDLLDGEGVSYLGPTSTGFSGAEHSYQAFGNDGNTYNVSLISDLTNREQPVSVINALYSFSDHLPVVADYQVPAILDVVSDSIPPTLQLGESFQIDVTVTNAADVVASIGADELDYTYSASGGVTGGSAGSGSVLALTSGDTFSLTLDTSSLGMQSGTLTVETDSLGAANPLVQVPISFEVVSGTLVGDYTEDGVVDAADYTVYRDTLGSSVDLRADGNNNGVIDPGDYPVWANAFGSTASSSAAVPEPCTAGIAVAALLTLGRRRSRRVEPSR